MRIGQLLGGSHRRIWESGLVWPMVAWSTCSLLSFYWPSHLLLAPWLRQLSAIRRFDLSLLRLPVAMVQQSGLLGLVLLLFALRVALSPALDAFVYGRLALPGQRRVSLAAFYRLYLLEILVLLLAGWLAYLSQNLWWGLLDRPGWLLLLLLTLCLGVYLVGLALSYYKARLASRSGLAVWPGLRLWLRTALAQGLLSLLFGLLFLGLNWGVWRAQGVLLLSVLLASAVVRTYGRLWKLACAVLVWQNR